MTLDDIDGWKFATFVGHEPGKTISAIATVNVFKTPTIVFEVKKWKGVEYTIELSTESARDAVEKYNSL